MNSALGIAGIVGLVSVLQGGLNRRVMAHWGLTHAVLLNNLVLLGVSIALVMAARSFPGRFPPEFAPRALAGGAWWYALPGLCGMVIVIGIPWAIAHLGAAQVFVAIVAAQLAGSLCWDVGIEGRALSVARIAGVVLALAGAWLASRSE
jgi:transporter family-2 protein